MIANVVRGLDHVGVTVPDMEEAERFFIEALGAEFIYETLNRSMPPFDGPATERMLQGPPGLKVSRIRMYKLGAGPTLELFEYDDIDAQRPPLRGCDFGWQHIAVYVDDMDAAVGQVVAAGAEQLSPPWDLTRAESGAGNRFCFVRTPFGALIELITYPSPQPYEQTTDLRRWKPPLP